MKNPFIQVRKDLVDLAQQVIDLGQYAPDPQIQTYHERKVKRLLSKYHFKKSQSPKYRSI